MFKSPLYNTIYIFVVLAFIIWFKINQNKFTGVIGEWRVKRLFGNLDKSNYLLLNDILLPSDGNTSTTQIDHIIVSNYGIFCIETKAFKGWIFGSAQQEFWTQVIYRHKERFYNPFRQNYGHTLAIKNIIKNKYPQIPVYSLVVFPFADKLKIEGTDYAGFPNDIHNKIKSFKIEVIQSDQRNEIFQLIQTANILDKEKRRQHTADVISVKNHKNN